jgi:isohexenylglutaconyl-CoA hydratase
MSLRIERHATHIVATLDRPAARNALDGATTAALAALLDEVTALAAREPATPLRALVITGSGGHFCAGGDFGQFQQLMATPVPDGAPDPIAQLNRRFGALLEALVACPLLTVACVDGSAFGGGLGLAAACDLVLCADDAQWSMPECTLGLPPAQIAPFVARRIGAQATLRLAARAPRLSGAAAQALGLADASYPSGAGAAALDAVLADIRRAEPQALRATKAILQQQVSMQLSHLLDFAAGSFAASLRGGTAAEGLAAFAARRAPAWAQPAAAA